MQIYIYREIFTSPFRDVMIMVRTNRVMIMQRADRINEQRNVIYLMIKALIHSCTCKSVSLPLADSRYMCLRVFTLRPVLDFYGCYMDH